MSEVGIAVLMGGTEISNCTSRLGGSGSAGFAEVELNGIVQVYDSIIRNCYARDAGAIKIHQGGSAYFENATITRCGAHPGTTPENPCGFQSSSWGGAAYVGGTGSTLLMRDSEISFCATYVRRAPLPGQVMLCCSG